MLAGNQVLALNLFCFEVFEKFNNAIHSTAFSVSCMVS